MDPHSRTRLSTSPLLPSLAQHVDQGKPRRRVDHRQWQRKPHAYGHSLFPPSFLAIPHPARAHERLTIQTQASTSSTPRCQVFPTRSLPLLQICRRHFCVRARGALAPSPLPLDPAHTIASRFPGLCLFSEIYQGNTPDPFLCAPSPTPADALLVTGPVARFARQLAGHGYIVAAPSSYHDFVGPEPLKYDAQDTDRGNRFKVEKASPAARTDTSPNPRPDWM